MVGINKFVNEYKEIKKDEPSYRLGQHFINNFIHSEELPLVKGLWEMNDQDALIRIYDIMAEYHWDVNDMPIKKSNEYE